MAIKVYSHPVEFTKGHYHVDVTFDDDTTETLTLSEIELLRLELELRIADKDLIDKMYNLIKLEREDAMDEVHDWLI